MSRISKVLATTLAIAALFSGNVRKLLSLASNAVVSDALAAGPAGSHSRTGSGATCN